MYNKFYIINAQDGEKKTSFETFPAIIKSELETSICLDESKNNLFATSNLEVKRLNNLSFKKVDLKVFLLSC